MSGMAVAADVISSLRVKRDAKAPLWELGNETQSFLAVPLNDYLFHKA